MADLRRGNKDYHYGATNLGPYDDWHYAFNEGGERFFVLRTSGSGGAWGDDKYVVVSADNTDKVLGYSASVSNNSALDWAKKYTGTLRTEQKGELDQTVETAADINYADVARFIDPMSGNVIDQHGLIDYLYTLPQFQGKSLPQMQEAIKDMPKLHMDPTELRTAQTEAYGDVYGIQQDIGQDRAKSQSEMGMSGVSSPSGASFGGTGESFAEGLYQQAGMAASGMQDTYGLADKKEQQFADWLSNFS